MKREINILAGKNNLKHLRKLGFSIGELNSWNTFVFDDDAEAICIKGIMVNVKFCKEQENIGEFFSIYKVEDEILYLEQFVFPSNFV